MRTPLASSAEAIVSPSRPCSARPSKREADGASLAGAGRSRRGAHRACLRAATASTVTDVRDRVALHQKELAAGQVHPDLARRALGVGVGVEEFRPALGVDVAGRLGPRSCRLRRRNGIRSRRAVRRRGMEKAASPLLLVRDAGAGRLVDQAAAREAVEVERPADLVMLAVGEQMGEQPAAGRDRLEAAGAPAAIEVEAGQRRSVR